MPTPLVSIITPAYNCGKYLRQTIASVALQSYRPIDYILIDDASTDETSNIVGEFKGMDTAIQHKTNIGEQATVNEGLRLVKGKYFMIVNADDPLLPGCISNMVAFMEAHPNVLCAYPDWNSINEDGSFKHHVQSREWDFEYMVKHHTCLPSVGSMFRSDVIETVGFRDTSFRWLGDFDYWLRVGLEGPMARVPDILATWRNRGGQASLVKSQARAEEHIRLMRKFYTNSGWKKAELKKVYDQAICWSYLVAASVTSSKVQSIVYIERAIEYYPKLFFSLEFYDAMIRRLGYILRR